MKKLIGIVLCVSLAFAPVRVGADDTTGGDMVAACVVAVVCVAVGGTIIVGVYKMCKKITTPPPKAPEDLPPYYIGTNGCICTNTAIVHPRQVTLRMPSAMPGSMVTLQTASSGEGWQNAYHFEFADNGGEVGVTVRDGAGAVVATNSFTVTNDGTNRWALCHFEALPMAPRDNQIFRLQAPQ